MTLGPNAGSAHITVKPSLRGWSDDVRRQLQAESKNMPDLDVNVNAKGADTAGKKAGDDFAGGFDKTVRRRIQASLAALPKTEIGVATNEAEQKIKDLRAELEVLSTKRIGIDIDAGEALAEIEGIRGQLDELSAKSVDINVKADTLLASTQLAAIHREVNALDRDDVKIKVDASSATSGVNALSGAASELTSKMGLLAGFGIVLIPVIAVVASLGATLLATLTAAGAGIGVLLGSLLGNILPVIKAQSELKQKQEAAATAAQSYASAQAQVASASAGVASAETSAARAISDAQRAVVDARRNAARSIQAAEESVASADQSEKDALTALSQAREDARKKLAAYVFQLKDAALAESGAALSVTQAQEALNEVLADPTSTQLQIDLARQSLAESRQSYAEAKKNHKDLSAQAKKDRAAGVSGDKQVVSAAEAVANAKTAQRDAERHLAEARADGARSVADAERNLARAKADGARQVAAAQAQLAQARTAEAAAAVKNGAAQKDLSDTMGKLSGPATVFVKALDRAKDAWHSFLDATGKSSFGLGAKFLDLFTKLLPKLVPLARGAARAVGTLLDDFGHFIDSKAGKGFLRWLKKEAPDAIITIGRAIGNIAIGLGGLIGALAQNDTGFLNLTRRFADFGKHAGKNSTVQGFFEYAKKNGPIVATALAGIAGVFVTMLKTVAPVGSVVLATIGVILKAFNMLPGPVKQILLGGFIGALIVAYDKVGWFRDGVHAAMAGVTKAITVSWQKTRSVLKAIGAFIRNDVAPAVTWLWKNIVKPVFEAIGAFIHGTWTRVIRPILQIWGQYLSKVLWPVIKQFGDFTAAVWSGVIRPVFVALGGFLGDHVVPKLKTALGVIATIWNQLATAAYQPIKFVVDVIYNDGLRKVINAIPGTTDVDPLKIPGPPTLNIPKFKAGGPVRGGVPGKDSVLSLLMPNEHVFTTEEVRKAGGHGVIARLRELIRTGRFRELGDLPAFAGGGALSALQIARGQQFARSQVGKPYLWGSAGPAGFDCSGFMSAITNVLRGVADPFMRLGSTATFPWSGFQPGPGQFTIGSTSQYPGSSVGHMAGTLDGLNVESRGGTGVIVGPNARGYNDPGFRVIGHLGASGGAAPGSVTGGGGALAALQAIKSFATGLPGNLEKLSSMGPWGSLIKGGVSSLVKTFETWVGQKLHIPSAFSAIKGAVGGVKGAAGSVLSHVFDSGGVATGTGMLKKATIHPERILSPDQTAAFERQIATLENWDRTSRVLAAIGGGPAGQPTLQVERFRIVDWDKGLAEIEYMATAAAEHVVASRHGHASRVGDLDTNY